MVVLDWIIANISSILAAIALSLVPGIAAIGKGMKFWPYFLISFLISPVISLIIVLCKKGEYQQFIEEKAMNELIKKNKESQKREGSILVKVLIWIGCLLLFIGLRIGLFFLAARHNNAIEFSFYNFNDWIITIVCLFVGSILARHICYHIDIGWIKKYTNALG